MTTVFKTCKNCGGTGEVIQLGMHETCTVCQGTGLVETQMTAQELKDAGVITDSHLPTEVKTAEMGDR